MALLSSGQVGGSAADGDSRGQGHEELVGASEEHEGQIADPDVVGVIHEEDQPGLCCRHAHDHQLPPQRPAELQEAGGEGCDGTCGTGTGTATSWRLDHGEKEGWAWARPGGSPSSVEAASTPPL